MHKQGRRAIVLPASISSKQILHSPLSTFKTSSLYEIRGFVIHITKWISASSEDIFLWHIGHFISCPIRWRKGTECLSLLLNSFDDGVWLIRPNATSVNECKNDVRFDERNEHLNPSLFSFKFWLIPLFEFEIWRLLLLVKGNGEEDELPCITVFSTQFETFVGCEVIECDDRGK